MDLEKIAAIEERKVEAFKNIADGLNAIAEAILQHATVNRDHVAFALENVSAAISNHE